MVKHTFSKHRMEALADGLFAIVMTLLVLDVKVPEIPRPSSNEKVLAALGAMLPSLGIFALTFILAGAFWFLHNISMQPVKHLTRALMWLHLVCLLFVSMLPFSASLFMRNPSVQVAQMVYYGNVLAVGLMLAIHWAAAERMNLISEDSPQDLRDRLRFRIWVAPAGAAGAMIGAAIEPAYAGLGLCICAVTVRLVARRRERSGRAKASAATPQSQ